MIRAYEHLQTFSKEVDEYLSTIKINMYLKSAPGSTPWLVVLAENFMPPIRLSVIAGDCIHNMRSALDNLVCGFALTQNPRCDCQDTKFPYTDNEAGWQKQFQKRLSGISSEAAEILRTVQPWCDSISPNPLLMLNKLNNMDKHRHCAFGMGYSQNTSFRIYCRNGKAVDIWPKKFLCLGDVQTFDIPVHPSLINRHTSIEARGTFVISFRDTGPWGGLHVTDVLNRCFKHVELNVIAKLSRFFRKAN